MHNEVLLPVAISKPRLGTMATSIRALVLTAISCALPSAQKQAIISIATNIFFICFLQSLWDGCFLFYIVSIASIITIVSIFSIRHKEWAGSPHRGHGLPARFMSPSSHPPGMGGRVRFVLFLFVQTLAIIIRLSSSSPGSITKPLNRLHRTFNNVYKLCKSLGIFIKERVEIRVSVCRPDQLRCHHHLPS